MKKLVSFLTVFLFASAWARCLRVVSLAPALTEIVFYLGRGKCLVGDTVFCSYPPQAKRKYKIGGYTNPNLERILLLKPDVVLATNGNPRPLIKRLRSLKIKVLTVRLVSLDDIRRAILSVGSLFDSSIGKEKERDFEASLKTTLKHLRCMEGKRFALIMYSDPYYVAGKGTYLSDILESAGAQNVFSFEGFKPVQLESLILKRPDVLIFVSTEAKGRLKNFKSVFIKNELALHPSPYFLKAFKNVCLTLKR